MLLEKPSIYNAPSVYNQGGGGGGGQTVIDGYSYPTFKFGNLEFIKRPLAYIPADTNYGRRAAFNGSMYYNGQDIDALTLFFAALPDGWRVPVKNDLDDLAFYLNSNSIIMLSNPDYGSPKDYVNNIGNLVTSDTYLWSQISSSTTYFLRLQSLANNVVINTAPYNGAKMLLYVCRDI